MSSILIIVIAAAIVIALIALAVYAVPRFYIARTDRTFMTHNDEGFKRALKGKGVIWDFEEGIVKGPSAPKIEFVSLDPSNGQRRMSALLDSASGAINLRPQYCSPLPFVATTADNHRMVVEARVQFSLNRDLMKYVYQLQDFALALETRIQSAFRAEIGKLQDEVLRASINAVEENVIKVLRQAERDGDEAGEPGMALGVNFHTASFTYSEVDYENAQSMSTGMMQVQPVGGGAGLPAVIDATRSMARAQGVLALRPQQLDQLGDVFKDRDPAATKALLAILEMQTRQNIAEALAQSGQMVVITAQELGLAGHLARDAMSKMAARDDALPAPAANGAAHHV